MDALCEQTGIIIAFLGGRPGHIGPALTAIGPELGHRDTLSIARRRAKEVAASSFISHEQARARKASRREPRYPFIDTIHDRRTSSPAQIGRAHLRTTVTKAQLVCRLLLEKKKKTTYTYYTTQAIEKEDKQP